MSKNARGLFDEQVRLEKLSNKQDPLERLSNHIDFEFFRKPLQVFFARDSDGSKGRRPPYDYILTHWPEINRYAMCVLAGQRKPACYYIQRYLQFQQEESMVKIV